MRSSFPPVRAWRLLLRRVSSLTPGLCVISDCLLQIFPRLLSLLPALPPTSSARQPLRRTQPRPTPLLGHREPKPAPSEAETRRRPTRNRTRPSRKNSPPSATEHWTSPPVPSLQRKRPRRNLQRCRDRARDPCPVSVARIPCRLRMRERAVPVRETASGVSLTR